MSTLHRCIFVYRRSGIERRARTLCDRTAVSTDIEAIMAYDRSAVPWRSRWVPSQPGTALESATCEGCRSLAGLHVDWTPVIAGVIFQSTLASSMLRTLALEPEMLQSDFMRQYHARSTRKSGSRSAFLNNMGRFVIGASVYSSKGPPCRVIEQSARDVACASGKGVKSISVLTWRGPVPRAIVRSLSNERLDAAFASLEAQMLAPRPNEPEAHLTTWIGYVRDEIAARADRHKDKATIVKLVRDIAAREFSCDATYPFFSAHYEDGEAPDDAIARLFVEERKHHATDEECALVMCNG